jgi:nucleoside-diphosphate-sugar epimerase
MKHISKIAVIGGTGKSGKYLVKLLLSQGFHLKLLLRNPETFQIKSPLIEVVQGDARAYESVQLLAEGCQSILSMLGQPKGEPTIFSQATKNVIRAMKRFNIERYIVTTGLNVDTPFDRKGVKTKIATDWMKANYPVTTSDKQYEFEVLSGSDINWTLVRLPMIEQTDLRSKMIVNLEDCPGEKISAPDLAHFVVAQLSDNAYAGKAPFIANV